MSQQTIRLGHSPDSDDAFMFYGLAKGLVDSGPFAFKHILKDIQTLNDWAREGRLEVTAVSVHAYSHLHERYAILTSGASMGATGLATYQADPDAAPLPPMPRTAPQRAQGPLVVSKREISLDELKTQRIAVPGTLTSAFLGLRMALGEYEYEVMDFDAILPAVVEGRVAAGLIIHEGQLTYAAEDLHCVLDLGRWWYEQTQLPLPLGCNLIRRDLGNKAMQQISAILQASIRYSLEHRNEALAYALQFGRGLDTATADTFVGMYVNEWTLDYGPKGRAAIAEFLQRGHAAGVCPPVQKLDFM